MDNYMHPEIQVGNQTFHRLFPDLLRPLSAAERDSLRADIQARGEILVPVVVDEHMGVIDGGNRLTVAAELGLLKVPFEIRPGLTHEQQRELALSLNECRRHLTSEDRKELALRLRQDGMSLRAIGERLNVPKSTVADDLVRCPKPDTCTGKDNKTYPARKVRVESVADAGKAAELLDRVQPSAPADLNDLRRAEKARRRAAEAARVGAEAGPLPEGPYRVIVADPPWEYRKRATDPTQRGAIPYPSMTVEEVMALPVADLAHDDCVLWLWTTNAHMPVAFDVLRAWGFEQKTILTWVKDRMGTGDWLRGRTEHCLLAVRGKPVVTLSNQTTVIHGAVREHSRKPEEFYELVDSLCPGSKVELFARSERPGWQGWGAELQKFTAVSGAA
jgi:N6-adenosine-specific RNA methylase IME4/ParB-like chromosome segregation protein Spo0J